MKQKLPITLLVLPFLFPVFSDARDSKVLSSRAQSQYRQIAKEIYSGKKVRSSRPVERVFMNSNVYRYEGNPTRRHDEVSSPEIIFHVDKSNGRKRVVTGHAFDR